MARLYSYDHEDALFVPDEEVEEKISSGRYSFLKGDRVHILDENKQIYNIAAEDARQALDDGFRFATEPIVEERRLKQYVQKNPSQSALLGFLRSMSFGLSDAGLQKIGVDEKTIKMHREENPGYTMAGEIGGLFTPFGLTGAGARLAGKAGTTAVSKLLAKRAESLTGKTIRGAVGGAAEGTIIGTQQAVSREILDDPTQRPLASEMILGSAGFGAAAGGVIGVVGGVLSKASPLLNKGKDYAYYRHLKARSPEYDALTKRGKYRERIYEVGKRLRELDKQKMTQANIKELDQLTVELEEKLLPYYGGEINRIIKDISKTQKQLGKQVAGDMFDPKKVGQRMRQEILDKELSSGVVVSPTARKAIKKAKKEIEAFEALPKNLDLLGSETQKRIYQKLANYRKNTDPEKFDLFQKMAYIIRDESEMALGKMEQRLSQKLGNRALVQEFKEAKNMYRDLADIHFLTSSATRRADVNNVFGLTSFLAGGSFGAAGPMIFGTESAVTGGLSSIGMFVGAGLARKYLKDTGMLLLGRVGDSLTDYGKLINNVGLTQERIRRGVNTIIQGGTIAGIQSYYPVPKTPETALKEFKKQRKQLDEIMRDERSIYARLQEVTPQVPTANQDLNQNIQGTLVRALTFLHENLPKDPNAGRSIVFDPTSYEPSNTELMKWQAYNEAINSPLLVLQRMSEGAVLPEHIKALSQVYPDLYKYMQEAMLESMTVKKPKLKVSQNVSLGTFVKQPLGLEMTNIAGLQSTFSQKQGTGLNRKTNKVQDLNRLIKTPIQGVA